MWTVIVRDPQGSEIHRLPLNGRLVIGRTHDCQIVLKSTAVSRQHARIEMFKGQPVFVDLGSSNGSLLDGQPVTKPVLLTVHSRIEIAGHTFHIEAAEEEGDRTILVRPAPPSGTTTPTPTVMRNPVPSPPKMAPTTDIPDDLDLVPMGPSVPEKPKPAVAASSSGMNFLDIPSAPPPTASAPKPRAATDSAVDLLDQQLAGIRNYRDDVGASEKARMAQLDSEWKQVLVAMQQLKDKVGKHPKIQHFTFSRDKQEVSVKVEDSSKRGYSYYVLSRRHPTGKYDNLDAVWLCELGNEELSYKQPKDAMADLVRRLAPRLA